MILVLLGTQNNSFHRLLEEVDKLINEKKIKDKVVVQAGYTKYTSENMEIFTLIDKEKLLELQQKANFIITHGGVGSIITSLERGKKVIAVPRKKEYAEHVNDHQEDIVDVFSKKEYLIGIKDVKELENAIIKIKKFVPKKYENNNKMMINLIEDFIEKV